MDVDAPNQIHSAPLVDIYSSEECPVVLVERLMKEFSGCSNIFEPVTSPPTAENIFKDMSRMGEALVYFLQRSQDNAVIKKMFQDKYMSCPMDQDIDFLIGMSCTAILTRHVLDFLPQEEVEKLARAALHDMHSSTLYKSLLRRKVRTRETLWTMLIHFVYKHTCSWAVAQKAFQMEFSDLAEQINTSVWFEKSFFIYVELKQKAKLSLAFSSSSKI